MPDTIDSASIETELMTGNADEPNQANGPLALLNSLLSELSNLEKIILGVPFFLFITTILQSDRISEDLQFLVFSTTATLFVIGWLIVLMLRLRKNRNRSYSLARERDLIVESWNIRYEQMHELRKKAVKIQGDLESLTQEGRLEPQNECLSDIGQLVLEIDKYIETTSRRVLELEQAGSVVKTPEKNQAIIDMLKKQRDAETVQESSSNHSASQ